MKHDLQVTIILILIFFVSQFVGLFFVGASINDVDCVQDDAGLVVCDVQYDSTAVGERPQTRGVGSLIYIVVGVAIGTAILLLLAKFNKSDYWRIWFFIAVWISVTISLATIFKNPNWIAWILALGLTAWKIYKPNIFVYNFTEILMYSGIAILLVPILDIFWMVVLLVLISIYDVIAVWKSGHMVTMAKFITKNNSFAGLVVPYKTKNESKKKVTLKMPAGKHAKNSLSKGTSHKNAILGGGDITFPLLFSGVVLQDRVMQSVANGLSLSQALLSNYFIVGIIGLTSTVAIALLFFFAKKDKFYPAMPMVSAGAIIGWLITLLI